MLLAAPLALAASGGTPLTISQTGYLLDGNDVPRAGALDLTFRVFDAASNGTLEWEGTCAATAVQGGYYAVSLGSPACPGTAGAGDTTLDTSDLPPGEARWLEVVAGTTSLSPRLTIRAAPTAVLAAHALDADTLGGFAPGAFAQASHGHDVAELTGLAPVATSGSYDDLSNAPVLATVATSGSYDDLSNTPSLAAVATSGSYADLSNTPSLAAVATSGSYADLSNTPSLAAVATSGSYANLSNTPVLGTAASRDTGLASGNVPLLGGGGNLAVPSVTSSANVRVLNGARLQVDGIADFHNGGLRLTDSTSGNLWQFAPATSGRLVTSMWNGSTWLDRINVEPNGNVGLGSVSPQARLDVAGDVIVSGTIRAPDMPHIIIRARENGATSASYVGHFETLEQRGNITFSTSATVPVNNYVTVQEDGVYLIGYQIWTNPNAGDNHGWIDANGARWVIWGNGNNNVLQTQSMSHYMTAGTQIRLYVHNATLMDNDTNRTLLFVTKLH